ncbi:acid protease [Sarocladium strictum]
MPSLLRSATALALLANGASAQFARAVAGDGFLAVPVGTVENPKKDLSKVKRDDNFLETVLDNKDFWYSTDLGFGNPPQNVTVLVDTGSSHLWINPDCLESFTTQQARECQTYGEYDPDDSNTPPVGPFGRELLRYGDASDTATLTEARLQYFADDVWFGGVRLRNQTFGVATSSSGISQGLFGLGPDLRAGFEGTEPHSLVLHSMADQGLISSRVFALDLRHAESQTGAIIYGGIDRNKFIGTLEARPIITGLDGAVRLTISMDSIGITLDGETESWELSDDETNVLLDSGSTLTRLHFDVALPILQALGAEDSGEGYFLTPCSARDTPGSVNFEFGTKTVRVPFSDFIIDLGDPRYCYIGVALTTEQQILGDTVLRAGYFVFDWDNEQVHVGQAANCGDSDIVAVGSGRDAVPDVTGNCDESDAIFTGTGRVTRTGGANALPTEPVTTTYTVTSCPPLEQGCETGVVVTETLNAVRPTVTVTSGAGGNASEDDDDEDAGVRPDAMTALLVVGGLMAMGWNLL